MPVLMVSAWVTLLVRMKHAAKVEPLPLEPPGPPSYFLPGFDRWPTFSKRPFRRCMMAT